MYAATAVRGRLARLLLLACTILGIAALHTLGHTGVPGAGHHGSGNAAVVTLTADAVAAAVPARDSGCVGCAHDHAAAGTAVDTSRGWEVCVAILGAFAVAVTLGLGLSAYRLGCAPAAGSGRLGPPVVAARSAIGLLLSTVAVLRT